MHAGGREPSAECGVHPAQRGILIRPRPEADRHHAALRTGPGADLDLSSTGHGEQLRTQADRQNGDPCLPTAQHQASQIRQPRRLVGVLDRHPSAEHDGGVEAAELGQPVPAVKDGEGRQPGREQIDRHRVVTGDHRDPWAHGPTR
jgi:hypothetical protein